MTNERRILNNHEEYRYFCHLDDVYLTNICGAEDICL